MGMESTGRVARLRYTTCLNLSSSLLQSLSSGSRHFPSILDFLFEAHAVILAIFRQHMLNESDHMTLDINEAFPGLSHLDLPRSFGCQGPE